MAKDKNFKASPIVATTYKYKARGIRPDGKTDWGESINKKAVTTKHTSFGKVKEEMYNVSKKRDDTFVNYGKKPIKSVTRRTGDTKTVTYFNRQKKN